MIEYLKNNALNENIEFLDNNNLLNNLLSNYINFNYAVNTKSEFQEMKSALRGYYYKFINDSSTNLILVGYDIPHENPTYIKFSLLCNTKYGLKTLEEYSVFDCKATMIFTIAQDEDIQLSLMGLNKYTEENIRKIIFELLKDHVNVDDKNISQSIDFRLETMLNNFKLDNLKIIVQYIELLPDIEILKLLDALIELTAIKKRFSNYPHSVGGKRKKIILHKYEGIKSFDENI